MIILFNPKLKAMKKDEVKWLVLFLVFMAAIVISMFFATGGVECFR